MSEQITLKINEDQSITIPAEIGRRLQPGTILTVEIQENGTVLLRLDDAVNWINGTETSSDQERPHLVEKDGVLVIRGKVEEGFDWDAFMQEEREAPLHPFEPPR